MADIPAGTGLGSSGSFTTALLKALHAHRRTASRRGAGRAGLPRSRSSACGEPIGKQDQYIAAFGGVHWLEFHRDGARGRRAARLAPETLAELEENLLLFFTGYSRSAPEMLRDQDDRCRQRRPEHAREPASRGALGAEEPCRARAGRPAGFAGMMNDHWRIKRERAARLTNAAIDGWYDKGAGARRPGRQADRRRGRRLPALLRGGQARAPPGPPGDAAARGALPLGLRAARGW